MNIGAGIAQAGEAVGKIAGVAALEQQKSGLETERLKLANDLAAQRESVGRKEQHTLNMETLDKTQTFQASEGDKTRATQLEASRISASASAASAGAHLTAVREQIAFQERQPDYKISDDGTLFSIPKQSKDASGKSVPSTATPVAGPDGQPMKVANPERAKAQAELLVTTRDQATNIYRLYETDLKQAQAELAAAQKSPSAMVDPSKDPGVVAAKKSIDDVRQKYEPKINTLQKRMDQIYSDLGVKAGMPTNSGQGFDLNKYLKSVNPPAAAPASPGILSNPDSFKNY